MPPKTVNLVIVGSPHLENLHRAGKIFLNSLLSYPLGLSLEYYYLFFKESEPR